MPFCFAKKTKNDPGRKKIQKSKDGRPDRQAASRKPVNGPDRGLAGWPANSPAGQRGNIGASQPAASQPAGWSASQAASQVASSRRPARQPSSATMAANHGAILDDSITKTARSRENPGKKKNGVNSPATELVDRLDSQQPPSHLARARQHVG